METEGEIRISDLFETWNSIPILKVVNDDVMIALLKPVRLAIIEALRVGIVDQAPFQSGNQRRYALSANEIRKELKSNHEINISYHNVYFYLNQLEEMGVLKCIGYIRNGKRTSRYFARTAKLFISDDNLGYFKMLEDGRFNKLLSLLNPEISEKEINSLKQPLSRINNPNLDEFLEWVSKYQPQMDVIDIDYQKLVEMYYLVKNIDQEFFEALKLLKSFLGIE